MKKDGFIRKCKRKLNKEKRKSVYKLSYLRWLLAVLLFAVGVLILSGVLIKHKSTWLSDVLISMSCGCFTGIALYFLVNKRNNTARKCLDEYKILNEICCRIDIITPLGSHNVCFEDKRANELRPFSDADIILPLLEEIEELRCQLDSAVYDVPPGCRYDPLDRDNMKEYKDRLLHADDKTTMTENIKYVCKELSIAEKELSRLRQDRENQLSFIGHSFI